MVLAGGRRDEGVSETIGIVLMVGLVAAMAGVLFLWIGIGQGPEEAPVTLGMKADGNIVSNTKQFLVTSVPSTIKWSELGFDINGKRLQYDPALTGNARFCVKVENDVCATATEWEDAQDTAIKSGQILRVRDPQLQGGTLKIIHLESNTIVAAIPVGD